VLKSRVTRWIGVGDKTGKISAYKNSYEKINRRKHSRNMRRWENIIKVDDKKENVRRWNALN
jgi:transcription initiation factor TFIIIB Brf1 subunit/transcription initiation factor TFIIB